MLIDECSECLQLGLGQRVDLAERRGVTFLNINFEVIGSVRSKSVGFGLVEYIREVMIFFGNAREVYWRRSGSRRRTSRDSRVVKVKRIFLRTGQLRGKQVSCGVD